MSAIPPITTHPPPPVIPDWLGLERVPSQIIPDWRGVQRFSLNWRGLRKVIGADFGARSQWLVASRYFVKDQLPDTLLLVVQCGTLPFVRFVVKEKGLPIQEILHQNLRLAETKCLARVFGNWQKASGEISQIRSSSGRQKRKEYLRIAGAAKYHSNAPAGSVKLEPQCSPSLNHFYSSHSPPAPTPAQSLPSQNLKTNR